MSATKEKTKENIERLIAGGMDAIDALALVAQVVFENAPTGPKRSAGAERAARYRQRKRDESVTKRDESVTVASVTKRDETVTKRDDVTDASIYILSSKKDSIKEERKKVSKSAKKLLVTLPENWRPPERAFRLAAECGTTVPKVEAIFRDYLKSSGKRYADHDAAFCNFIRNQRKFDSGKSPAGPKWNGLEGVV